jgi:uncharacterized protein (DUF362 family)/ferredoxin
MDSRPQVALVRCDDYDLAHVEEALRRSLDLIGGLNSFIQPNQRVLLKPNLLRAMPPERAATTHPAIVAIMAKLVVEVGAHPIVLDSPGGPYSPMLLRSIYRKTGMLLAEEYGAELNFNIESVQVSHPEGVVTHRLDIVQRLQEVDAVINLPKLKTHNLTGLTMAVKNLFGLVPGMLKLSYHSKMQDRELFSGGLVDILTFVKPTLNIMDAVVGMEGDGPSGGQPRQVGAILASANALALDVVGADLVGYDPLTILTTFVAAKRGLTTGLLSDVTLLGDALVTLRVSDFRKGTVALIDPGILPERIQEAIDKNDKPKHRSLIAELTMGWWARQLLVSPQAAANCIGCGYCVKHCPVNAIEVVNGKAHMDARVCIRCYCCHELCPELAIELKRPWLGRLLVGK